MENRLVRLLHLVWKDILSTIKYHMWNRSLRLTAVARMFKARQKRNGPNDLLAAGTPVCM